MIESGIKIAFDMLLHIKASYTDAVLVAVCTVHLNENIGYVQILDDGFQLLVIKKVFTRFMSLCKRILIF